MASVKNRPDRAALTEAVMRALRESSGLGVLHSQAMAERLGVSPSDLECLDIIVMRGPITAGDLARASGLTTGAITGLVDRLERAGFARRAADPDDRRKVLLVATPAIARRGARLARPMEQAMTALLASYDDKALALMLDFMTRANTVALDAIEAVRALPAEAGANRPSR